MTDEARYHVMALTPTEQAVLRTILSDHFRRQSEAIIAVTTGRSPKDLDASLNRFNTLYDHFDACSAGLPSMFGISGVGPKVLYLQRDSMRYLTNAVEMFDPKKFAAGREMTELLDAVYPRVKARVSASCLFDYTLSEIRAEERRK